VISNNFFSFLLKRCMAILVRNSCGYACDEVSADLNLFAYKQSYYRGARDADRTGYFKPISPNNQLLLFISAKGVLVGPYRFKLTFKSYNSSFCAHAEQDWENALIY
jgi:hypothetical protein